MVTINHLVSDIREIASSGGNPNEFKIQDEQILFWVEEVRSMLISQALNKKDDINDSWIQYISCLEMEQTDSSDCCGELTGCYLLKSKLQLPATIDTWKDNSIVSVATIGGSIISKSNPFRAKFQIDSKYTGKVNSWYLKDNYLYIINNEFLEKIEVAGLFESPSDLKRFSDCSGKACFNNDSSYPVSLSIATQITDIVIKTKVAPFMQFPMDNSNDSNGETPNQKIANKQSN